MKRKVIKLKAQLSIAAGTVDNMHFQLPSGFCEFFKLIVRSTRTL
jgi:hypothetical protein